jgi:hypothetical protein
MDSWNLRTFRNDLSIFIKLIKDKGVTGDFSDLETLLSEIDNKQLIQYDLKDIMFYLNKFTPVVQPLNLNYCEIHLNHMLMCSDSLDTELDPLFRYVFDIRVSSFKSATSSDKTYFSSWHHDKHPDTSNVKYTHPTYHFQFGGKKMELIDDEMSVLSCPRLPHPPMDIFLGFHFILSNYYSNKQYSFVNSLLLDYDYQQIIKRAQKRLWSPYFKAFDSTNTHQDFTMNNLFPLYIS